MGRREVSLEQLLDREIEKEMEELGVVPDAGMVPLDILFRQPGMNGLGKW